MRSIHNSDIWRLFGGVSVEEIKRHILATSISSGILWIKSCCRSLINVQIRLVVFIIFPKNDGKRDGGGIKDTTQNDNVIYKQPLTLSLTLICDNFKCNNSVSVTFSGHGRTFDKVPYIWIVHDTFRRLAPIQRDRIFLLSKVEKDITNSNHHLNKALDAEKYRTKNTKFKAIP